MNAPTKIDRAIGTAEQAALIECAAREYRLAIGRTGKDTSFFAMQAEVKLLRAIDRLWPDFMADQIKEREGEIANAFGCDVDGYPLDVVA